MFFSVFLALTILFADGTSTFIPMSDGVKLFTVLDLERVHGSDHSAIGIIDRSPYGIFKTELLALAYGLVLDAAGVRQDMRGTGRSGGTFDIWHSGSQDGYDTIAWLANQTWSNGQFWMIGGSADGINVYEAIKAAPPWLTSTCIIWSTANGRVIAFPQGAYRKSLIDSWMELTVPHDAKAAIAEIRSHENPFDPWWDELDMLEQDYRNINAPVVFWAGWYDIFLRGNLMGYAGVRYHSKNSSIQQRSRLVIDPLGHCQGAAKYFPHHLVIGRSLLPVWLSFLNFHNMPLPDSVKQITFYVMGPYEPFHFGIKGNYWTSLDDWPTFTPILFYLNSDRSLSQSVPSTKATVSFQYDPRDPVPSLGGNNLEIKCGPLDQHAVEQGNRSDVLTFTSAVLTEPLAVTGPLRVRLFVSTDVTDTDFTAKLTDVYPDGTSRLIQDGIIRMRWRDPRKGPQLLHKDSVYEADISLWNTSYVFNPRHQLRVSISSSNSPRFEPNPNTGQNLTEPNQTSIVAHNVIHIGPQTPSALILPVVSLDKLPEVDIPTIFPPSSRNHDNLHAVQESIIKMYLENYPVQW